MQEKSDEADIKQYQMEQKQQELENKQREMDSKMQANESFDAMQDSINQSNIDEMQNSINQLRYNNRYKHSAKWSNSTNYDRRQRVW